MRFYTEQPSNGKEAAILNEVMDILTSEYPRYDWGVEITPDGTMVKIQNGTLQANRAELYGMCFPIAYLNYAKARRPIILRNAGELIERAQGDSQGNFDLSNPGDPA